MRKPPLFFLKKLLQKNEHYGNGDVQLDRSAFNVHFKECEGGYLQTFDKLIEDGIISTRGLQRTQKSLMKWFSM